MVTVPVIYVYIIQYGNFNKQTKFIFVHNKLKSFVMFLELIEFRIFASFTDQFGSQRM